MEDLGFVATANQFSRSKAFLIVNNLSLSNQQQKQISMLLPGKRQRIPIIHRKTPGRGANRMDISR